MTPEQHRQQLETFRRIVEDEKARYPGRAKFRSIGDELSGHNAVMFTAGIRAAGKPGKQEAPPEERSLSENLSDKEMLSGSKMEAGEQPQTLPPDGTTGIPSVRRVHRSLAGKYPLRLDIYDWDTAGSITVDGNLRVEETGSSKLGVEEYEWNWRFTVSVKGKVLANEAAYGANLRAFLASVAEISSIALDVEDVSAQIRMIPRFKSYLARMAAAYKKEEDAEFKREEAERRRWEKNARVRWLRCRGYSATRDSLGSDAETALRNLDVQAMKKLSALGFTFQNNSIPDGTKALFTTLDLKLLKQLAALGVKIHPKLWRTVIDAKRKDVARWLIKTLGVDVGIQTTIWNNAYSSETPLTLAASRGWREGVELLLSAGASTRKVVSFASNKETRYHDVDALLRSFQISVDAQNPKRA